MNRNEQTPQQLKNSCMLWIIVFLLVVIAGMGLAVYDLHQDLDKKQTEAPGAKPGDSTEATQYEAESIPASLPVVLYRDSKKVFHCTTTCKNVAGKAVTPWNVEDITMLNPQFCTQCLNDYQIQSFFNEDTIQYEINP